MILDVLNRVRSNVLFIVLLGSITLVFFQSSHVYYNPIQAVQIGCDVCGNPEQFRTAYENNLYQMAVLKHPPDEYKIEQAKEWLSNAVKQWKKNPSDQLAQNIIKAKAWIRQAEAYKKDYEQFKEVEASIREQQKILENCYQNCQLMDPLPSGDEDTIPYTQEPGESRDMPGAPAGADLDNSMAGKPTLPSPPPTNSPCAGLPTGQHCESK